MSLEINLVRLASAMIALAYSDLTETGHAIEYPARLEEAKNDRRTAYAWVVSDYDEIMSFVWCCSMAGRSVDKVRSHLLKSMGQVVKGRRKRSS